MKNLVLITNKADIHDYVAGLWKTDLFRDSHRKGGFVHGVVDQFAWLPRAFCDMTNEHIERAHFSTWWNVITHRHDYTNPVISDLYWLHEIYHAAKMPYIAGIGKAAFDDKMQRNELEASVLSEIQIYFEMPELRPLSFEHEIYADRFLSDPSMQSLWKSNPVVAVETIRSIRRDVMVSKPEHLMDVTERWIRLFAEQNIAYSISWSERYLEVEQHMSQFQIEAAWQRQSALDRHRYWIEEEAARDTVDNVPFRQEGELFSAFYWANKDKYNRAMVP